jgi:hypothetical protein
VGFIFMPEVPDRAQNRIGNGLPKRTKGRLLHLPSEVFEEVNVSFAAFAPADSS